MELLAGARDEHHLQGLRRLLARATLIPTVRADYENAAMLYRQCRNRGETVRKLVDCLIAAVAIRSEVAILHDDRDFDVLAWHTELQTYPDGRDDAKGYLSLADLGVVSYASPIAGHTPLASLRSLAPLSLSERGRVVR